MKYKKGVFIRYRTIFGWTNWKGKVKHIWKILFDRVMIVESDIPAENIEIFERTKK